MQCFVNRTHSKSKYNWKLSKNFKQFWACAFKSSSVSCRMKHLMTAHMNMSLVLKDLQFPEVSVGRLLWMIFPQSWQHSAEIKGLSVILSSTLPSTYWLSTPLVILFVNVWDILTETNSNGWCKMFLQCQQSYIFRAHIRRMGGGTVFSLSIHTLLPEQQTEYVLRGGLYASCVHAGGLSCSQQYLNWIQWREFNQRQCLRKNFSLKTLETMEF